MVSARHQLFLWVVQKLSICLCIVASLYRNARSVDKKGARYEKSTKNAFSPRGLISSPHEFWWCVRARLFLWVHCLGAVAELRRLLFLRPYCPQDAWRSGSNA